MIEQDFVKAGALDLKGFGELGENALSKSNADFFGAISEPKLRAAFDHETGFLQFRPEPQFLKDLPIVGQQGFTDMKAGELFLLQDQHLPAQLAHFDRGGGTRWSSSNDDCVPHFRH